MSPEPRSGWFEESFGVLRELSNPLCHGLSRITMDCLRCATLTRRGAVMHNKKLFGILFSEQKHVF